MYIALCFIVLLTWHNIGVGNKHVVLKILPLLVDPNVRLGHTLHPCYSYSTVTKLFYVTHVGGSTLRCIQCPEGYNWCH